jgi:hypothetical protein
MLPAQNPRFVTPAVFVGIRINDLVGPTGEKLRYNPLPEATLAGSGLGGKQIQFDKRGILTNLVDHVFV